MKDTTVANHVPQRTVVILGQHFMASFRKRGIGRRKQQLENERARGPEGGRKRPGLRDYRMESFSTVSTQSTWISSCSVERRDECEGDDEDRSQKTEQECKPSESEQDMLGERGENKRHAHGRKANGMTPEMVEELMGRSIKYLLLKQEHRVLLHEVDRLRDKVPQQEAFIQQQEEHLHLLQRQIRSRKWNDHLIRHPTLRDDVLGCRLVSKWGLALLICALIRFSGLSVIGCLFSKWGVLLLFLLLRRDSLH